MFVRRKKNRSGTTSVVVVDKHGGKFKELHIVGVASDEQEVAALCKRGREWIKSHLGILELDFESADSRALEEERATAVLNNIDAILLNGAKLILDKVYDSIGFNSIDDNVLRNLVAARLCQPMSKMATAEYLKSHFYEDVNLSKIYRYLDKLYNTQQEAVQRISVEHTLSVLGGRVEMLFYDVTSLYFESFVEDGLRVPGFSKDGKTAEAQITLGLLVCGKPSHRARSPRTRLTGVDMASFWRSTMMLIVSICEEKIREDEKWDGLKGYVTNTSLPPDEVVAQYHGLWVVERAFRISKGTIETRPIFHFTEKRRLTFACVLWRIRSTRNLNASLRGLTWG